MRNISSSFLKDAEGISVFQVIYKPWQQLHNSTNVQSVRAWIEFLSILRHTLKTILLNKFTMADLPYNTYNRRGHNIEKILGI